MRGRQGAPDGSLRQEEASARGGEYSGDAKVAGQVPGQVPSQDPANPQGARRGIRLFQRLILLILRLGRRGCAASLRGNAVHHAPRHRRGRRGYRHDVRGHRRRRRRAAGHVRAE